MTPSQSLRLRRSAAGRAFLPRARLGGPLPHGGASAHPVPVPDPDPTPTYGGSILCRMEALYSVAWRLAPTLRSRRGASRSLLGTFLGASALHAGPGRGRRLPICGRALLHTTVDRRDYFVGRASRLAVERLGGRGAATGGVWRRLVVGRGGRGGRGRRPGSEQQRRQQQLR